MKKTILNLLFLLCLSISIQAATPQIKYFTIENLVDPAWGELISVYDQKSSSRLTFNNNGHITMVLINMSWSAQQNRFIPQVKQVISIEKKQSLNNIDDH